MTSNTEGVSSDSAPAAVSSDLAGTPMRGGRLVEVGHMECEETTVVPPGPGDVIVRSAYASICGSDLHTVKHGVDVPPTPCPHGFPGHEGIGTVVESHSEDLEVGDVVLTVPNSAVGTCFNEYQTLPGSYCLALPPDAGSRLREYLMAQQLGTVIWALRRNPVDVVGRTVVILGQGSAGLFFTYLMRRAGAETIITSDLSDTRLEVSRLYGADRAVKADSENLTEVVADLTAGVGADHVVEAVGRRETLVATPSLARVGGTVLWFGLPDSERPVPFDFRNFFRRKLTGWSTYGAQDEPRLASFAAAAELIRRGEIDVSPLLTDMFPVEEIDAAFALAHEPQGRATVKVSVEF